MYVIVNDQAECTPCENVGLCPMGTIYAPLPASLDEIRDGGLDSERTVQQVGTELSILERRNIVWIVVGSCATVSLVFLAWLHIKYGFMVDQFKGDRDRAWKEFVQKVKDTLKRSQIFFRAQHHSSVEAEESNIQKDEPNRKKDETNGQEDKPNEQKSKERQPEVKEENSEPVKKKKLNHSKFLELKLGGVV